MGTCHISNGNNHKYDCVCLLNMAVYVNLLSFDAITSTCLGIQQENCAIRLLQKENQEMRESLVDYQTALELIMNKYRQQKVEFMNDKK